MLFIKLLKYKAFVPVLWDNSVRMNCGNSFSIPVFLQKSFFFLLTFLTLFVGVNTSAWGQITTLKPWTNVYHGIATSAQTSTYTIPTGSNSNRVLVVAIASSTAAASSRTVTLTYGGQTPTASVGDMATSTVQQHTQLYYFNEAKLDAASNTTLSVAVSGGTTRVTDVFAAVFDGIDQTNPITDSKTYSSGTNNTTNPVFASALSVNANDLAIEIISSVRLSNTTPRTITYATNWTMAAQQTWTTTDGVRNAVANRSIPTSNTTDVSSVNLSGSARASMTAISLKAYVPATPPNCSTPISPTNSATGVAVNSALSWNSTFGATGYRIYLGTDALATNIVNDIDLGNVTSYTPPSNLSYITNYYWKIVPYNSFGLASGCTTWSFTTEDINYCAPTYSNGTSYGDYISLVQLGNINN